MSGSTTACVRVVASLLDAVEDNGTRGCVAQELKTYLARPRQRAAGSEREAVSHREDC